MSDSTINKNNFDQYINDEIDRVSYPFSQDDWSALKTMLDDDSGTGDADDRFGFISRIWKWLVGGVLIALAGLLILNWESTDISVGEVNTSSEPVVVAVESINSEPESDMLTTTMQEDSDSEIEEVVLDNQSSKKSRLPHRVQGQVTLLPLLQSKDIEQSFTTRDEMITLMPIIDTEKLLIQLDSVMDAKRKKYLAW